MCESPHANKKLFQSGVVYDQFGNTEPEVLWQHFEWVTHPFV